MTTDAAWTRFVRSWRKVFGEHINREIAKQRVLSDEGCRNDPYRNVWCTCCP